MGTKVLECGPNPPWCAAGATWVAIGSYDSIWSCVRFADLPTKDAAVGKCVCGGIWRTSEADSGEVPGGMAVALDWGEVVLSAGNKGSLDISGKSSKILLILGSISTSESGRPHGCNHVNGLWARESAMSSWSCSATPKELTGAAAAGRLESHHRPGDEPWWWNPKPTSASSCSSNASTETPRPMSIL